MDNKKFNIHTVAFYNLENLFDTINDPTKYDEASPIMEMNAGRAEVYKKKVHNMAKVIADIGKEDTNNSPVVIGVSEIENRDVLEDLLMILNYYLKIMVLSIIIPLMEEVLTLHCCIKSLFLNLYRQVIMF